MNNVRKVILHLYTNWCGEDQDYTAIICDECESDFENEAQRLAYENFQDFDGFNQMMKDEFGEPDEDDE